MKKVYISGTGLYTPAEVISNEELVDSFNAFVRKHNREYADEIAAGSVEALQESSVEFIEKASGIKQRHVINKSGILDIERMCPVFPARGNEEPSLQSEISVVAAREAMAAANKSADEVDAVLMSCANPQRAYPAVSIEIQQQLGTAGFAFDMNVACSSATFALQVAIDMVRSGSVRSVLIVNPEITSAHLNYRDRDSHFIFGDVCTAIIVEGKETLTSQGAFEVLDCRLKTSFSNNIRNNFGFINRCEDPNDNGPDKLFVQQGRQVFKEVVPMVASFIGQHLADNNLEAADLRRMWLHQANLNMNLLIGRKILGREATEDEAPVILDRYANTASAGSIIAFHLHKEDLAAGDVGLISSFGAGYSVGSVLVRKN